MKNHDNPLLKMQWWEIEKKRGKCFTLAEARKI
jgi:hypothetical protein